MTIDDARTALFAATISLEDWKAAHARPGGAKDGVVRAGKDGDNRVVAEEGDGRVEVVMGRRQEVRELADELGRVLAGKGLFLRVGEVWYFDGREGRLKLMTAELFASWVQDFVRLMEMANVGSRSAPDWQPVAAELGEQRVKRVLRSLHFRRHLPAVRTISEVPLPVERVLEDGDRVPVLLKAVGGVPTFYADAGGVLVLPGVEVDEGVDWEVGVGWLTGELLREFPIPEVDRGRAVSVVLAGMLSCFGRLLLPERTKRPAFVTLANAPGGGKTLLAQLMICPTFGPAAISTPPRGKDDAETAKTLFAAAVGGGSYVFFDNCEHEIGGAAIEGMVTASQIEDRILGRTERLSVPLDLLFFFSGNRAKVTDDMRRRSLVVELFVEEARPEDRRVERWMDENGVLGLRSRILGVLWAVVRHWAGVDRPGSGVGHGSFQVWADVIGGMCEAVGLVSPVSVPCLRSSVNEDLAAFDVLLPLVLEEHVERGGDVEAVLMKSGELMGKARELGAFSFLQEDEPSDDKERRSERAAWGKRVEKWVDRWMPSGVRMRWAEGAAGRACRKLRIERRLEGQGAFGAFDGVQRGSNATNAETGGTI